MNYKYDVTAVLLTYNPKIDKILLSLNSLINQKNIKYEILVCDDGSKNPFTNEIVQFFAQNSFNNYRIINQKENNGTVINCLNAAKNAQGKYLFLTSPGDIIYDDMTLADFFNFAEKNNYEICFGNAIFYNLENNNLNIINEKNNPNHLQLYKKKSLLPLAKTNFFLNNDGILGAAYFRKTSIAVKYFEIIKNFKSKYVEDTTSTLCALADNVNVFYYNRNIIWYEYGTGVSTSSDNKWNCLIENDYESVLNGLKINNPKNPYIDLAYIRLLNSKKKSIILKLKRILKHPKFSFEQILINMTKIYTTKDLDYDKNILDNKIKDYNKIDLRKEEKK